MTTSATTARIVRKAARILAARDLNREHALDVLSMLDLAQEAVMQSFGITAGELAERRRNIAASIAKLQAQAAAHAEV